MALVCLPLYLSAQEAWSAAPSATAASVKPAALPDAPAPQIELAQAGNSQAGNTPNAQQTSTDSDPMPGAAGNGVKNTVTQNCPGSQTSSSSSQQPCNQKSQKEEGQEEIKEQEKQRVEGVVPTFNVTYHHDAVVLTPGQKMNLSLHSAVDPFAFAAAFLEAGYHEADNDLVGFPWGPKGFFERAGAGYLDNFDGTILSTGVFPIIFRQDPRYFRMGPGSSTKHRIYHSLASNFIAKNDYNSKWGPNYGNLLGNFAAGELSNLYYPSGNTGFGLAATTFAIQIVEGAGGSIFNEFWPDISRKVLHKDPTHGLDAQQTAAERNGSNSSSGGDVNNNIDKPVQK